MLISELLLPKVEQIVLFLGSYQYDMRVLVSYFYKPGKIWSFSILVMVITIPLVNKEFEASVKTLSIIL